MRVRWSTLRRYRCFYNPSVKKVEIVSSNLVPNADGRIVSDTLVFVVDAGGEFCDLEMTLTSERRIAAPMILEAVAMAQGVVDTYIDEDAEPRWSFDEAVGALMISFTADPPKQWVEIHKNYLYLSIDPRGRLEAIVAQLVEIDPEGEIQSSWLDELEAEIGQADQS